jgi:hypothetical protein
MEYFSYVVEHDYGLAPNPFGGYCTLAVCKPDIRKNINLNIGDWIIGTGSQKLKKLNHLIFAMQLEEKLTFDGYWEDKRFQYKKPIINGSLVQMYGDNFYHKNSKTQEWIQEVSAHSTVQKEKHLIKDTSSEIVLISQKFYYLGDQSLLIPQEFNEICKKRQGMKYKGLNEVGAKVINWLSKNSKNGISGDPLNWKEYDHKQTKLLI